MATNDENLRLTAREIAAACATNSTVPLVLTIDEAAVLLRIPKATLYDWRSHGLLSGCCRRVGKRLLFFRDRLFQKAFNDGLRNNGK
jgi:hypothetical protein